MCTKFKVPIVFYLIGHEFRTSKQTERYIYEKILISLTGCVPHVDLKNLLGRINKNILGDVVLDIKIKLSYPDIAEDGDGNKGTWTMVYNQGFEVKINNREYFAFSRYTEVKK